MKRGKKMLSIERREKIKEILLTKKNVTVAEMAELFSVSTETIRRDFELLSNEGFLIKTYGGASLSFRKNITVPQKIKSFVMREEKQRMAKQAVQLIHPNDCIFLDHSTTVFALCEFLSDIPLTVMTNSLPVMEAVSQYRNIQLCVPSGDFDQKSQAFFGIETIKYLKQHCFDKSFISCTSLDMVYGIHDSEDMIAELHRSILECTDNACLIADHTKFDRSAFVRTSPIESVDILITDEKVSEDWRTHLKEYEIHIIESEK
ncbi:DeoR/GlpR transcriptional regulator [Blautia liquoris]|uniref:DeoR/GlpR transcriptional regulator n=1 Tax=Blautia liquoris TaxID=2779518 RepID=A0A7M2REA4_9FIRM|nr:DeoR/GlpR family DNA-binding transcription regulator [Blautia liquoris]QOV18665.1 DeoR/GlpR transcriptional regulator [Blautia liquoris]